MMLTLQRLLDEGQRTVSQSSAKSCRAALGAEGLGWPKNREPAGCPEPFDARRKLRRITPEQSRLLRSLYAATLLNIAATAACFVLGKTTLGVVALVGTIVTIPGIYAMRYMFTHPKR
jgi:hypothetical protein